MARGVEGVAEKVDGVLERPSKAHDALFAVANGSDDGAVDEKRLQQR